MMISRTNGFSLAALLTLSTVALASPQSSGGDAPDVSTKAMEWLRDIQTETVQIADHASKLKVMSRDPLTYNRVSQEFELVKIRDSINSISELVPRLQNRTDAPSWQKEIIDEVASLLTAMSAQAEKSLNFVRDVAEPIELDSNAYEARLVSIDYYAQHINELVDYADERAERRRQGAARATE